MDRHCVQCQVLTPNSGTSKERAKRNSQRNDSLVPPCLITCVFGGKKTYISCDILVKPFPVWDFMVLGIKLLVPSSYGSDRLKARCRCSQWKMVNRTLLSSLLRQKAITGEAYYRNGQGHNTKIEQFLSWELCAASQLFPHNANALSSLPQPFFPALILRCLYG